MSTRKGLKKKKHKWLRNKTAGAQMTDDAGLIQQSKTL